MGGSPKATPHLPAGDGVPGPDVGGPMWSRVSEMSDIRRIQQRIQEIYRSAVEASHIEVPTPVKVMEWVSFAQKYIDAASLLDGEPSLWLPRLQMTGHSVECALKACLASSGIEPPKHHDLVKLYELASQHGVTLGDPGLAAIVHLGCFYYQDIASGTRYKARYPTDQIEGLGGAVPQNSQFLSIVQSLIEQATEGNQTPNREEPRRPTPAP